VETLAAVEQELELASDPVNGALSDAVTVTKPGATDAAPKTSKPVSDPVQEAESNSMSDWEKLFVLGYIANTLILFL
jgi:hypothetical protein